MVVELNVFATGAGQVPKWLGRTGSIEEAVQLMSETGVGAYFVLSRHPFAQRFYEVDPGGVVSSVLRRDGTVR